MQTHLVRRTTIAALLLGLVGAAVVPFLLDLGPLDAVLTGLLVVTYSGYMFLRGTMFGLGLVERATVWDVLSAAAALAALAVVVRTGYSSLVLLPLVLGYGVYVVVNVPFRGGKLTDPVLRRRGRPLRAADPGQQPRDRWAAAAVDGRRAHRGPGRGRARSRRRCRWRPRPRSCRGSLSLVLFPSLSAAYGRGDHAGLRAQVDTATRSLSVISVATFGPLMIISPALIAFFYRRGDYSEAAVLLVPLLLAVLVLNVVIGATNSLLTREYRHARVVMVAGLTGAAVGALAWLVVVPALGVLGVALGYLLGSAVMAVVPLVVAWRLDQMRWAGVWIRFSLGTALAVALAIVVQRNEIGTPGQVALAGAMLLAWTLVSWRDVVMTVRLFVRAPELARSAQGAAVDLAELLGDPLGAEPAHGIREGGERLGSEPLVRVEHRGGPGVRVAGPDEGPHLPGHEVALPAHGADHDGAAVGQGLGGRHAERLVPRGQQERRRPGEVRGEVTGGHAAEQHDPLRHPLAPGGLARRRRRDRRSRPSAASRRGRCGAGRRRWPRRAGGP